jgi:hypothetical protein
MPTPEERAARGAQVITEWSGNDFIGARDGALLRSVYANLVSILYGDQSPAEAVKHDSDQVGKYRLETLLRGIQAAYNLGLSKGLEIRELGGTIPEGE